MAGTVAFLTMFRDNEGGAGSHPTCDEMTNSEAYTNSYIRAFTASECPFDLRSLSLVSYASVLLPCLPCHLA